MWTYQLVRNHQNCWGGKSVMVKGKKFFQGWSKKGEGHYCTVSLNTKPFDVRYVAIAQDIIRFKLIVKMTISSWTRFKFNCDLFSRIYVVAGVNFTWMTMSTKIEEKGLWPDRMNQPQFVLEFYTSQQWSNPNWYQRCWPSIVQKGIGKKVWEILTSKTEHVATAWVAPVLTIRKKRYES